jgi:hypothetical protein
MPRSHDWGLRRLSLPRSHGWGLRRLSLPLAASITATTATSAAAGDDFSILA